MIQQILSIEAAIKSGDKAHARRLLQPLLERTPTAELWYFAALASETPDDEAKCLSKVLALDPTHGKAKSRMIALQQAKPADVKPKIKPISVQRSSPPVTTEEPPKPRLKSIENIDLERIKPVKHGRKRSSWRLVGCLGFIAVSLASSFFVMSVLGMGFAGWLVGLLTGSQPVTQIDGVPIEDVAHAPLLVPANRSVEIEPGQQQVDILYPGYAHEFMFNTRSGVEMSIFVQFISPTAKNVSPNVVVVDPSGNDAESRCDRGGILTDNSGVTFTCRIDQGGGWRVRIFGREGESSGAYYVTAQQLE
jgi:hypothetical protein